MPAQGLRDRCSTARHRGETPSSRKRSPRHSRNAVDLHHPSSVWNIWSNRPINERFHSTKKLPFIAAFVAATLAIGPAALASSGDPGGFEHAPTFDVAGEEYYSAGAPDGSDGATDIPGHYWEQAGPTRLVGKYYNTGPFDAPSWWSSDAPDGELLYVVNGIIDTCSPEKAERYAKRAYVHYHEMISVADGTLHPTKVMWLKHTAVASFTLDGGPHPELSHDVTPGVDTNFIPNGMMPYTP
jgi:selenium-binding protein 1